MVIGEQPENYDSSDAYYSTASAVISDIQKHINDWYQFYFDYLYAMDHEFWRYLVDMIRYALEFSVTEN
jgi:hypothetical protein